MRKTAVVVSETTDLRGVEMLRRPPNAGRVVSDTDHETARWEGIQPPGGGIDGRLWVVDGIQRQEATVAEMSGDGHPLMVGGVGAVASGAAQVRVDRRTRVGLVTVERLFCSPSPGGTRPGEQLTAAGVVTGEVFNDSKPPFGSVLDAARQRLEQRTRRSAQEAGGWVLVDGRYNGSHPRTVGIAKQHQRKYLTDEQYVAVERLRVGQRTPLFRLPTGEWSWYTRIESNRYGVWSGMVRLETGAGFDPARAMADMFTGWLPSVCSRQGTPRAPENLTPISGLEKHLRKRLGNPGIVRRRVARALQHRTST